MKSKKRHHASSDESEDSNVSDKSSSSDSESEESSEPDHRYKKKKKHADTSDTDSHSDDQKRSKKRKHKKKKKKHGKKKRRSESVISDDDFSISDEEFAPKKKKKHKHKSKRASTASEDEEQIPRRLHSVVKEPRALSNDGRPPSRTYYQKEYRRSASVEIYDREQEVQRFYRGSSKEHKYHRDDYSYDRQRNDRVPQQNDRYDRTREKFDQSGRYDNSNADQNYRQRNYDEFKRPRYEDRRPDEQYNKRSREDTYYREDTRANDRYNQFDGPKKRELNDNREYRDRRAPPEPTRYREREFVDKKEKPRDERFSPERNRELRRERPTRPDKQQFSHQREQSRSPEDRLRQRNKRSEQREPKESREPREQREPRESREPREEREERRERRPPITDNKPPPRERKSRFTDAEDNKEYSWGKADVKKEGNKGAGDKEKPNFGLSGKLTADTNTVNGVVIKYSEPDDAKQPKRRWRFYPFKGDKALPILYIHRQSCFLLGRDKLVADIPLEHPSVSKQHAALQYRATPFTRADGSQGRRVRPYIIDLDSANGTFVNNKKIEPRRYVELLERDVVKFGFSQREYVLLHENSKDDAQDDDQEPAPEPSVTTTDQIKAEKRIKEEIAADDM